MVKDINITSFYKLEDGYTMTRLDSRDCNLIFRDQHHDIAAILEGDKNNVKRVNAYRSRVLNTREKAILHRFIRLQRMQITTEVADILGLSVLSYADRDEEYLSEEELKARLEERLICTRMYIGRLKMHSLKFASFSHVDECDLRQAQIKKLVIEDYCDANIDMTDNLHIEGLRVGDNFNGQIDLSKSTVDSIFIKNNCRCDLIVQESKHCFNLVIQDIYSGNLNLKDSHFHAVNIGYYCYAVINLENNFGSRDITIGDSFRGSLNLDDVKVYSLNLGKDCKGQISLKSRDMQSGSKEIVIADDFCGTLDLQKAPSVEKLEVGSRARGRFNLGGNNGVKMVRFNKYFNGYADFSNSSVEYVSADYGSSGDLIFNDCENLILLELPRYKNSNVVTAKDPIDIVLNRDNLSYRFLPQELPTRYFTPFYKKVYHNLKELIAN